MGLLEQQQEATDRKTLCAAIDEGEAARARGEFVTAEGSRRSRRTIIERYRPE